MNRKFKIGLLLTGILLSVVSCTGTQKPTGNSGSNYNPTTTPVSTPNYIYDYGEYANPIPVAEGAYDYRGEVADPAVVRDDETGMLWSFSTNGLVLKSTNGTDWEVHTRDLIGKPSWGADYGNGDYAIWAPDVCKIGNNWIYYYSLSGWGTPRGIGLAVSTNGPGGPYVDKGKLFSCDEIGIKNCIDSHTFIEEDGSVYMSVGSFQGIFILQLTNDGLACEGGVANQKENKELIAGKATTFWDGRQYEGSYIIKKGGYYYYFGSTGTCCEGAASTYKVVVARSNDLYGPYYDHEDNPMVSDSGTPGKLVLEAPADMKNLVAGPGHHSLVLDDKGDYYMYYHAFLGTDNYDVRHLMLDKLLWDEEGWPYVQDYKPSYGEYFEGPSFIIGEE